MVIDDEERSGQQSTNELGCSVSAKIEETALMKRRIK
jgi:hypothetical protein